MSRESIVQALPKPALRGVLHQRAFVIALAAAPFIVVGAQGTAKTIGAAVFAFTVVLCLGTSAVYHRVPWTPRARLWMQRADHAGVYLLIAGTYTPVCLFAMDGAWGPVVLAIVWVGTVSGIILKVAWVNAPQLLTAGIGIALGWLAVVALPQLVTHLRPVAFVLLAAGGLVYTAGAIVYARRRPDPFPAVFGYHELFHALTIVAIGCQYVAIAFFVVRVH